MIRAGDGLPVAFDLLPASPSDLTPIHELAFALPPGAVLFGDKGYLSQANADSLFEATGVRLVKPNYKIMLPSRWADNYDLPRALTQAD